MAVYENYTCFGPYLRKDGRKHVVLVHHNDFGSIDDRITVSYPKYLVEKHLGRTLNSNETVDHIDGNFDNNELSNLRIIDRSLHSKSHAIRKKLVIKSCSICGNAYTTTNNYRITCGSPICRGKCAHVDGYNCGNHIVRDMNEYTDLRGLIQEIVSVEGANSGNLLVENPEQG